MKTCDQIREAVGAHGLWKGRLKKAIQLGSSDMQPSVVARDNQCAFGKWLYGESLTPAQKQSSDYVECRALHRSFHTTAANVLALALSGKKEEANHALESGGDFHRLSTSLTLAMTKWHDALACEKVAK